MADIFLAFAHEERARVKPLAVSLVPEPSTWAQDLSEGCCYPRLRTPSTLATTLGGRTRRLEHIHFACLTLPFHSFWLNLVAN